MTSDHGRKVSEKTLSTMTWVIVASGCVAYIALNLTSWAADIYVLSAANFVLLLLLVSTLLYIVRLLKHMQMREEEMADMRGDFVAVASHELRSPLSAVRWYLAELRGDATLSQDARRITNDLYERICSLIDLTTTFLLMTSADKAPLQSMSLKSMNIVPLINEAITAAISTARSKSIKVELLAQLEAPILVKADPARLRIVFDNLLSNAIKYSHEGSTVTFSYDDQGQFKRFSVHDTGIGVPKDEIEKIFSGYHRAANARRSGKLGSGFGLYMAKKIVEMHGGAISCESKENEGTTFRVALPSAI